MIHYHVKLSDQAENDLRTIFEYIAFELLSPNHAKEQLERLEEQIDRLDQMPEHCASYKEEPGITICASGSRCRVLSAE